MRAGCGRAPCLCRCWIGCSSNRALRRLQQPSSGAVFGGNAELSRLPYFDGLTLNSAEM
jgi:hypothetical protein